MMNNKHTEYCLCQGTRILLGPLSYDRQILAAALQHHGGSIEDIPLQPPEEAVSLLYLTLLPVVDTQAVPAHSAFYHPGQAQFVVSKTEVKRTLPYQLYPLDDCMARVTEALAKQADQGLALLEKGYTEREVKSWPQQRAEAAEYTADNTQEVPLLKGMAARRGIPLATFVEHVQAKVKTTADLTAIILGDAQAANDQIKALQLLDKADQLPDDWFDQLMAIADHWRKDWPEQLLQP